MEKQKLPNATIVLVFGIMSVITCCCYGVIGLILGIIGVVLANNATKVYLENPEMYSGYQNLKNGKVLCILGIILSFLYLLLIVGMIMLFGFETLQDQELLQEKMQELMNQ